MHNTIAFSGGFMYRPTTSTSLSSNFGSPDTLNVSTRCGLRPRFDQIRCTVAELTPTCLAIVRHDQCVAPAGVVVVLNRRISAIVSSGIEVLRPRPALIFSSPANPSAPNRRRHARTVSGVTPTSSAITALATPSPANNNALACNTCRCGADCARANRSNVSRSASDNGNGAAGALITPAYRTTHHLFTRHTTSSGARHVRDRAVGRGGTPADPRPRRHHLSQRGAETPRLRRRDPARCAARRRALTARQGQGRGGHPGRPLPPKRSRWKPIRHRLCATHTRLCRHGRRGSARA